MRWIAWMKSLNLKPMPTKIAQWQWRWKLQPEPEHHRLGGEAPAVAVAEVDDPPLALVEVLRAPDGDRRRAARPRSRGARPRGRARAGSARRGPRRRSSRSFAIRASRLSRFSRAASCTPSAASRNSGRWPSPVEVALGRGRHLVPAHVERRELVALVGVAEVGGPLHEQRPRRDPQPELVLLVREQRELVGLRRVALEEPGLRLADVHDVRGRRRRRAARCTRSAIGVAVATKR